MSRRRSSRSLITPAGRRKASVGIVIPIPRIESAAGAFQRTYASQAIATRKMPSPSSETAIPAQSRRKSRWRSGARSFTREKPPGRSSASWLCSMRSRLLAEPRLALEEVLEQRLVVHRLGEQEPLAELAPEVAERLDLLRELDPLRHHVEVEAVADRDDRRGEVRLVLAGAEERA